MENEPLLTENKSRYCLFPIQHNDLWQLYKKQVASFWTSEECEYTADRDDFDNKLTDDERHFVKMVLAFFASSDGIVIDNLGQRFLAEAKAPELVANYTIQMFMEQIHSEVYSLLIDSYISNEKEKRKLFNAIEEIPCIKKKADWAIKWINDKESNYATRLVAFACMEGILFSSSFACIYYFKKRNLLKALTFTNELISRDEGMHTELACLVYRKLNNKLSEETIHKIIKSAVDLEIDFTTISLPCNLIGMNSGLMVEYIKFVADRLATQLGVKRIYDASNPFGFMELISLENKANMFESNISAYSLDTNIPDDDCFNFTSEF